MNERRMREHMNESFMHENELLCNPNMNSFPNFS